MPKQPPVIALLTDFGARDHYVGAMKGVILSVCPNVRIIDLSHEVGPQGVAEAAYLLWASYAYLPFGTIVLVVVDPGVGTSRGIMMVKSIRNVFVAPDNGVLDYVLWQEKAVEVFAVNENSRFLQGILPRKRSSTFHGRDVFAPLAAHIAGGAPLPQLGRKAPRAKVREPFVSRLDSSVEPKILHIDRFGNIITNILQPQGSSPPFVKGIAVGRRVIDHWIKTYEEAPPETPCLIAGSSGLVEIVMNRESAGSFLHASSASSLKLIG